MKKQASARDGLEVSGFLTIKTFKDGVLVRETAPMPNKVVSSSGYGRNVIARVLANDNTYTLPITTAALGSGSNAPADGDTGLQTSVVSGLAITNATVTNNVVVFDVFVPDATLTNGTYREFGLFASGRLFCRIAISPAYTKATGEDTLFVYTLTISG